MRKAGAVLKAVMLLVPLAPLTVPDTMADEKEYVPEAKAETLHQAGLPGVDGREVIIKRFTFPGGYVGGKHIHPGPVYVYVLEGEFTMDSGGETTTYRAGDLYPEPLNQPMQPRNASASDDLKVLVFQVGEVGKPMMIKAE